MFDSIQREGWLDFSDTLKLFDHISLTATIEPEVESSLEPEKQIFQNLYKVHMSRCLNKNIILILYNSCIIDVRTKCIHMKIAKRIKS